MTGRRLASAALIALSVALGGCGAGPAPPHPLATVNVRGDLYEASAPDRPACYVEPSRTVEGFEVIFYPDRALRHADLGGFEVPCPEQAR